MCALKAFSPLKGYHWLVSRIYRLTTVQSLLLKWPSDSSCHSAIVIWGTTTYYFVFLSTLAIIGPSPYASWNFRPSLYACVLFTLCSLFTVHCSLSLSSIELLARQLGSVRFLGFISPWPSPFAVSVLVKSPLIFTHRCIHSHFFFTLLSSSLSFLSFSFLT